MPARTLPIGTKLFWGTGLIDLGMLKSSWDRQFTSVELLPLTAKIVTAYHLYGIPLADGFAAGTGHAIVLAFPQPGGLVLLLADYFDNGRWADNRAEDAAIT